MNGPDLRMTTRVYRRCAACLALVFFSVLNLDVYSQEPASADTLSAPPNSALVPLHLPDLTNLEEDVARQLESMQSSLAATVNDARTDDPTLADAYGALGQTYHAYSLVAPARECYLNANRLAPNDFRWVYLLAKLDEQEDRADDAIVRYTIARRLRPGYTAVPVNLGNIYLQTNRIAEARQNFEAALENDRKSAAALYGLGQVALSQQNYAEAAAYFEKALAEVPAANRLHYSLAMAYRGLGDIDKARSHMALQGTVGVRVDDPLMDELRESIRGERVHLTRGKLALEAKQYVDAVVEFKKAIAANPDSIAAHVNLGAALFSTGDVKGAVEQYEKTLRIDSTNTNAHFNLAILSANAGNHESAVDHLRSVVTFAPQDINARFFLARELLKSGRPAEALAEFSRIVDEDPNNEEALLDKAILLQNAGQFEQARDSLEKGHARYPHKGLTAAMLAHVLAASPRYSVRDGARALELASLVHAATGSTEHGALVALALAELGRCSEAAEWQLKLIRTAERQGQADLAAKLRTGLQQFTRQPCRPPGENAEPHDSGSDQR